MEKSIKSASINYGIYLGVLLILITVLVYVVNLALMAKWWLGVLLFLVVLGFGIFSAVKAKGFLKGFISFKQAFSAYFITIAIGVIISTVVSILLFNVIDPEASDYVKEKVIEESTQFMERFGTPQSEIDKAVLQMQEDSQFSTLNQLKSIAFQLAFFAAIGLLVALVVKKTDPNLE